ncbi:hypothetical protein ACFYZ2_04885 [Streptomyces sviceus]|uniref:hypothetical protein n=1 Tax=Streptomyces sviceus TaxID=285530 RepID=UPI0036BFAF99
MWTATSRTGACRRREPQHVVGPPGGTWQLIIDMDARSITLRSETDQDVPPKWLAGLFERYIPGPW